MSEKTMHEVKTALEGLVGETGLDEESCVCDNTHDQHGTECQYCYARKVLKKQLPQKVIQTEKHSQSCPICGSAVNWRYCSNCGQKLSY